MFSNKYIKVVKTLYMWPHTASEQNTKALLIKFKAINVSFEVKRSWAMAKLPVNRVTAITLTRLHKSPYPLTIFEWTTRPVKKKINEYMSRRHRDVPKFQDPIFLCNLTDAFWDAANRILCPYRAFGNTYPCVVQTASTKTNLRVILRCISPSLSLAVRGANASRRKPQRLAPVCIAFNV